MASASRCRSPAGWTPAEEVSIYEAGGVLQRFAQDFLESTGRAA
jgi:hypothetical protein